MSRFALCGACLALLAACGVEPARRSVASTPIGTDASTGLPSISARGLGPGGINRDYGRRVVVGWALIAALVWP